MNGAVAFLEPATVSDLFDQKHYGKIFVALDVSTRAISTAILPGACLRGCLCRRPLV